MEGSQPSDADHLLNILHLAILEKDDEKITDAIKKIILCMTSGIDVSSPPLFGEMIKVCTPHLCFTFNTTPPFRLPTHEMLYRRRWCICICVTTHRFACIS